MINTIFEMIRGAYFAIEMREGVVFNIICRSLTEHLIDLLYIASNNSIKLNKRFVNYPKLLLYWNRREYQHIKSEIASIEKQYRDYIIDEFQDMIRNLQPHAPASVVPDMNEIDRKIKDIYKKSWTGLDTVSRINKIEYIDESKTIKDYLPFAFKNLSNYTHPTPYSCLPHFSPPNNSYEYQYDKSSDNLEVEEGVLFLALSFSVETFCLVLDKDDSKELHSLFEQLVSKSPLLHTPILSMPPVIITGIFIT